MGKASINPEERGKLAQGSLRSAISGGAFTAAFGTCAAALSFEAFGDGTFPTRVAYAASIIGSIVAGSFTWKEYCDASHDIGRLTEAAARNMQGQQGQAPRPTIAPVDGNRNPGR
ncbi:hypothetical protein CSA80_00440 [Candidatus Saccharibacteria bacterium]|nr:MAG: hypothetical protein CR973_00720 [Candidatus Saccharibacteria bacterium]PID99225.1 MAG: hypothetical protein CSA80_00440 [Candidatus Saccharibacteria bacterium]